MRFVPYLAAGLSTAFAVAVPRGIRMAPTENGTLSSNSTTLNTTSGPTTLATNSGGPFWLDSIDHNGVAPGAGNGYKVYRNVVKDFGAKSDGSSDAAGAINNAISDGDRKGSTMKKPAHVYLPGGTYQIGSTINLLMGTILMGDPNDPPVLKASSGLSGTVVNGYDDATGHPEDSFMIQLRNVVIDTTGAADSDITALQWGVAQGCAIGNVNITMPFVNPKHTGMNLKGGSTIAVTDMHITGGKTGISNSNQQVNFKNIGFQNVSTAYDATGGWTSLLQKVTFDTCGVGINLGGGTGDVVLLDSESKNSGTVVQFTDSSNASGNRNNQVVIENLKHDTNNAIAVASGKTVLPAQPSVDTWVYGNAVPGQYVTGKNFTTQRPAALLQGDSFFTASAPTFGGYSLEQVKNVKSVQGVTVHGDGKTDDSAALNQILADNAKSGLVTFIPHGQYVLQDTLYIPPGSRIMGEAWPVFMGSGNKFQDAKNPAPVVQVGKDGETGVAQITDVRFTVADVLPGAKIVEVNMAGNPGDVGLWNCVVTIGGTAESQVTQKCSDQDTSNCMAAFVGVHLTKSSSAYIQNAWVWTADHALDGGPNQIISTKGGVLVESTKATWLVGTGSEHHWLYNYNFHAAQNVFAGLLQTETPYMQGDGATQLAPAPWTADAAYGDPDFAWCDGGDGKCRSSIAANVDGGENIFLYNSASWAFFNGPWDGAYDKPCQGSCQTNMNRVANGPKSLAWYAINTKSADTMVLDGQGDPKQANNPGSWGGNLVAYRQFE